MGLTYKGVTIIVVTAIFTLLASLAVVTRLYARLLLLKNGGRDEITIVLALMASFGLLIATVIEVHYGLGQHQVNVGFGDEIMQLKALWVNEFFYNIALALTKISIILQYLRVFVGDGTRRACWIVLAVTVIYSLQATLVQIFNCVPVAGFWDFTIPARCVNKTVVWFIYATVNILLDLAILILPMPALWSLKMPTKQRLLVISIFALGGFACLTSILRLESLYIVTKSEDNTWDTVNLGMWSNIEVNTGIICSSLQTIRPVISRFFPNIFSMNRSYGSASGTNKGSHSVGKVNTIGSGPRSHKRSHSDRDSIQLTGLSPVHQTITRISAKEKAMEYIENERNLVMVTRMTQEAWNKSQTGSENDLILQRQDSKEVV